MISAMLGTSRLCTLLLCTSLFLCGCYNKADTTKPYIHPKTANSGASSTLHIDSSKSLDGYLQIDCNFFDHDGNVVLKFSNHRCELMDEEGLIFWSGIKEIGVSTPSNRVIWSKPINGHHDFHVDKELKIGVAVVRRKSVYSGRPIPYDQANEKAPYRGGEIWHDGIELYNLRGEKVFSWYADEHLPELSRILEKSGQTVDEGYYVNPQGYPVGVKINSATILKNHPQKNYSRVFADGNIVVSFQKLDYLAIIHRKSSQLLWNFKVHRNNLLKGGVHYVRQIKNGNLLFFENHAEFKDNAELSSRNTISQAVEFDMLTKRRVWTYPREPENGFHNPDGCSASRLENGNTLVAYDYPGRILEVTRSGEIVWDRVVKKKLGHQSVNLMGARKISKPVFNRFIANAKKQ